MLHLLLNWRCSLKCLFLLVSLLVSFPAFAIGRNDVKYLGGTAPGVNRGTIGKLDTTSKVGLVFDYRGGKLIVPYKSIESFRHTSETARHLGVLPSIVTALLKARQKRHLFRISYCDRSLDQDAVPQVVILEVPKGMSPSLEAVLDTCAPHRGRSYNYRNCWR